VRTLFDEIRQTLAECVFNCAAQAPLGHRNVSLIVNYLKKHAELTTVGGVSGCLDVTNMYLAMAVLYCFDSQFVVEASGGEGAESAVEELAKGEGLVKVFNELARSDFEEWHAPGIKAVFQFGFHVFLTVLSAACGESGRSR